jgi:hypothetical protein
MAQFTGKKGQGFTVKIRPGKERLAAVEGECHPGLSKIPQPCHNFLTVSTFITGEPCSELQQ